MQPLDTPPRRDPLEPRAERRVAAGPGKEPARQRAIVEPVPPTRIGSRPRAVMSRIDGGRLARVARRRVLLGRIRDVDHVMRNALAGGDRHLVGADVEPAVDGRRVAADDFAVEPLRERDAERALAGGGRTEDRDEPRPLPSPRRERAHDRERRQDGQQQQQADLLRPRRLHHDPGFSLK